MTFGPTAAAVADDDGAMDERQDKDRVVVGVDGSESSVAALRYAARIADAFGAPLEVITTWSYPPIADPYILTHWSPEEDAAANQAAAITRAFGANPPDGLTRTVLIGPAARALIEASDGCAMLVVGSRGRGGFAGLLLGSVSTTCAQHARCPVVIVHGRDDGLIAPRDRAEAGADRSEA